MSNSKRFEQKVGSKGEIYLKKELRNILGIKPSDSVIITTEGDKLIITKKLRFKDIAKLRKTVKISQKQNKMLDEEIQEQLES